MRFDQAITSIPVADLDRSAAFYEGILGLARISQAHDQLVWQLAPRAYLGARRLSVDQLPPSSLTLITHDLDTLAHQLAARGLSFERGPDQLLLRDPDGHAVTLQRPLDLSWPVEQTTLPTRPNVAAALRSAGGLILLCERIDHPGVWQLPQGGQDPGESPEETLWRELGEEIGLADPRAVCQIVYQAPPVHYAFPDWLDTPITRRYEGQDQIVFIVDYHGDPDAFDMNTHHTPEFRAHAWLSPDDAIARLAPFKRHILARLRDRLIAR